MCVTHVAKANTKPTHTSTRETEPLGRNKFLARVLDERSLPESVVDFLQLTAKTGIIAVVVRPLIGAAGVSFDVVLDMGDGRGGDCGASPKNSS